MKRVDFYFDYLSPFAYFAALALPDVCRRHGAALDYHPVLFAGLLDHWGHLGPAEIPPKAMNVFRQCVRHAALHDVAFRGPRFHPFVPLHALRASLPDVAGDDQPRVVEAIFRAGWGRGIDLGSADALASALDEAGLDGERLLAAAREPDAKQALREGTDAAIARGVFGVPTMCVREGDGEGDGDELFWGVDQIPHLELHLEGRDPLAGFDLASIRTEGPAAVRPGSRR